MPKITRAEAKQGLNSVGTNLQKADTTLNGNDPPKPRPGPLALLSLDTPSLTSPCYNVSTSPPTNIVIQCDEVGGLANKYFFSVDIHPADILY